MTNTIVLKGSPIKKERVAASGSAIKPGMLLQLTSAGEVEEHGTAQQATAGSAYAVEPEALGMELSDAYAAGDQIPYVVANRGDEIYAWLEAGTGNDVAIGALLESAGDGTLQAGTTGPIARALEAVDNDPGVGGAAVRIKVEVL